MTHTYISHIHPHTVPLTLCGFEQYPHSIIVVYIAVRVRFQCHLVHGGFSQIVDGVLAISRCYLKQMKGMMLKVTIQDCKTILEREREGGWGGGER